MILLGEEARRRRNRRPDHPVADAAQLALERTVLFTRSAKLSPLLNREILAEWADHGVRSRISGRLIKLESFYFGQRRATTVEAYQRFMARLNAEEELLQDVA